VQNINLVHVYGARIHGQVLEYNAKQMEASWLRHVRQNIFTYLKHLARQKVVNFLLTTREDINDPAVRTIVNRIVHRIVRRICALEDHEISGYEAPDDSIEDDIPDNVSDNFDVCI
jgi:hypothetical protein